MGILGLGLYSIFWSECRSEIEWKWLKGRVNEIGDVKRVFRELLFSQLPLVEVIDKQTDGTLQGIRTT